MKTALVVLACFLSFLLSAQTRPGGGSNPGTGVSRPTNPGNIGLGTTPTIPTPDIDRSVFINGKVVMSDGSPVSESVSIESNCNNRKRIETYTDSHGNFNFELKKKPSFNTVQTADISSYDDQSLSRGNGAFQFQGCELEAVLPGFSSEVVELASHMSSMIENVDIGRIVLHPIGNAGASVLSVTSLKAPNSAKKAMDKARDQEKKNKISDAEKSLEKAVEIYPQYAAAWTELGRLQFGAHDNAAAQHSFEQALAADPKYAKPYLGLAELATQSHNWQSALDLTTKLLAMNSSYPTAWLIHGIAQYNLRDYDGAEASARSGLKIDPEHRVPRLEHLLGLITAGKGDYVQGAEHMRAFLKYATQPSEQAEGQRMLAEIERRSAQANLAPAATTAK
jgi:tetratricopeptide (TPR) repeat protein